MNRMEIDVNPVTIVCGCKNRLSFLKQSIPSWISQPSSILHAILIVDWQSNPPVKAQDLPADPRITILRVDANEPEKELKWHLSRCLNFGFSHVRTPLALKLDCDYVLQKTFLESHILQPKQFFRGSYKIARNSNEHHLNGALMVWTSDFCAVGGYNEYIYRYGWDDSDLYDRLVRLAKLEARHFNYDLIAHIPHGDDIRLHDASAAETVLLHLIRNMFISQRLEWTSVTKKNSEMSDPPKRITDPNQAPRYQVRAESVHQVSDPMMRQCTVLAKKCILADHHNIPWHVTEGKPEAFIHELYEKRHSPKLIVRGLNGLGNKIRAIASAAVVAQKLECMLLIEWIPDHHCRSKMTDLLDCSQLLVSSKPLPFNDVSTSTSPASVSPPSTQTKEFQVIQEPAWWIHEFDQEMETKLQTQKWFRIATACVLPSRHTKYRDEALWIQANFRPVPRLAILLEKHLKAIPDLPNCIGIHSRRGQPPSIHSYEDSSFWTPSQIEKCRIARSQSHHSHFIREMQRLRLQDPATSFFVCADRKSSYVAFRAAFPQDPRVHYVERDSYDRTTKELDCAMLDILLLSRTKFLLGSPWSTFSELVQRLGTSCRLAGRDFPAGSHGYRGVLMYQNQSGLGGNLGDNIQSLAASGWFNHDFHYFVNRDLKQSERCEYMINPKQAEQVSQWMSFNVAWDQEDSKGKAIDMERQDLLPDPQVWYDLQKDCKRNSSDEPVMKIIWNAWTDGRVSKWPPPPCLDILFISLHINEDEKLFTHNSLYKHVPHQATQSFFDTPEKLSYWQQHSPIGCRDQHTLHLFQSHKIPAYYSGCLTLSLPCTIKSWNRLRSLPYAQKKIYVVDCQALAPDLWRTLVPEWVRKQSISLSHVLREESHTNSNANTNAQKVQKAQDLLYIYQAARYVITSRLHCALPCLAMGVPVLFLLPDMDKDVRYDDTMRKLLGNGRSLPNYWSWSNPMTLPSGISTLIQSLQDIQRTRIIDFLGK